MATTFYNRYNQPMTDADLAEEAAARNPKPAAQAGGTRYSQFNTSTQAPEGQGFLARQKALADAEELARQAAATEGEAMRAGTQTPAKVYPNQAGKPFVKPYAEVGASAGMPKPYSYGEPPLPLQLQQRSVEMNAPQDTTLRGEGVRHRQGQIEARLNKAGYATTPQRTILPGMTMPTGEGAAPLGSATPSGGVEPPPPRPLAGGAGATRNSQYTGAAPGPQAAAAEAELAALRATDAGADAAKGEGLGARMKSWLKSKSKGGAAVPGAKPGIFTPVGYGARGLAAVARPIATVGKAVAPVVAAGESWDTTTEEYRKRFGIEGSPEEQKARAADYDYGIGPTAIRTAGYATDLAAELGNTPAHLVNLYHNVKNHGLRIGDFDQKHMPYDLRQILFDDVKARGNPTGIGTAVNKPEATAPTEEAAPPMLANGAPTASGQGNSSMSPEELHYLLQQAHQAGQDQINDEVGLGRRRLGDRVAELTANAGKLGHFQESIAALAGLRSQAKSMQGTRAHGLEVRKDNTVRRGQDLHLEGQKYAKQLGYAQLERQDLNDQYTRNKETIAGRYGPEFDKDTNLRSEHADFTKMLGGDLREAGIPHLGHIPTPMLQELMSVYKNGKDAQPGMFRKVIAKWWDGRPVNTPTAIGHMAPKKGSIESGILGATYEDQGHNRNYVHDYTGRSPSWNPIGFEGGRLDAEQQMIAAGYKPPRKLGEK